MVLGSKKTHKDDETEGDIAKGAEVEEVVAIAIELLDCRKYLKEIDPCLFIINKQNFYDLFDAFKKLHTYSGDITECCQEMFLYIVKLSASEYI